MVRSRVLIFKLDPMYHGFMAIPIVVIIIVLLGDCLTIVAIHGHGFLKTHIAYRGSLQFSIISI